MIRHKLLSYILRLTTCIYSRKNIAVSSVVSTLLLLSMSMLLFASLYYLAFSTLSPSPQPPNFDAVATIDGEKIIILHKGGESVDVNAEIIVRVDNTPMSGVVEDYLDDTARENGLWDVDEKIVFDMGIEPDKEVNIMIVDPKSNKLLLKMSFNVGE